MTVSLAVPTAMRADEALALLDQLLPGYTFSNLQEIVFSQVWEGRTYAEIADSCGYDHSYIRDVGFRLWQALSESLHQKVSKSNIRAVLERHARSQGGPAPTLAATPQVSPSLEEELPNGPVPLQSTFYIDRPPLERQAKAELLKPGSLVRLEAPRQTGKTSLLRRLVAHGQAHPMACVTLSLHRADRQIVADLDRLLRWFCANIGHQLGLEPDLDRHWHSDRGSKMSCTTYLENQVLSQINTPLLIAIDEIDELFQYPQLAAEFLTLLRSWYEDAREIEVWSRVRWVLSWATEVPLPLPPSAFNIGLALGLPPFTLDQAQELAHRHMLPWADSQEAVRSLVEMVGGRPGLLRRALHTLAQGRLSLAQLLDEAPTQAGLYGDHLRELLAALYPHPDLQVALRCVVEAAEPVVLEPIAAHRLENLGLVTLGKNRAVPSCELYRQYFLRFLPPPLSSTYGWVPREGQPCR